MNEKSDSLKVITLDSIDSTNEYAFVLAEKNEDEIVAVRAGHQTQGRGRRNSVWSSPKGAGIYASFLLRPQNRLAELVWLPLFFSYAAACCLGEIINVSIKWPNDIMINNKKIGGVLIEAKSANEKVDFAVAGIGLNINSAVSQLPPEATSLYIETNKTYNIDELFERLLTSILAVYKEFKQGNIESLLEKALSGIGQKKEMQAIIQKYSQKHIKDLIILR